MVQDSQYEHERAYQALVDETRREFPAFRLIRKDRSMLQRSIHHALALVTLGGQRSYLTDFVTTLGQRVYVPAGWDARDPADRWATLRHERVHLRQFRRWGFPLMALLYLALPLPLGLAYFRMRFEREAYEETVRAYAERKGRDFVCNAAFRSHIVGMFTGGAYGWMWPFPRALERWYDALVASIDPDPNQEIDDGDRLH